jgi:hypothetical protein
MSVTAHLIDLEKRGSVVREGKYGGRSEDREHDPHRRAAPR